MRMAGLCVLLLAVAWPAHAADLSTLKARLAMVRATHGSDHTFDAGPELNGIKQALRDWAEPQLPPPGSDIKAATARMNRALHAAKLTCGDVDKPDYRCPSFVNGQENDRGYVDEIQLSRYSGGHYLVLTTGTGVYCGFDHSAYLYEQKAGHWRMVLSIETQRYSERDYASQNFATIAVSPDRTGHRPLVAATAYSPWCSSNWNMLHTRLWRADPANPAPHPLLDRAESLYTGNDGIATLRLKPEDLRVTFAGGSLDSDNLARRHTLHYTIGPNDRLTRIAPVADTPVDFVDEWLAAPWAEASGWSAPGLEQAHARTAQTGCCGTFGTTRRCPAKDLRQVTFTAEKAPPHYFLVREGARDTFTLTAVSAAPFPGCDTPAP